MYLAKISEINYFKILDSIICIGEKSVSGDTYMCSLLGKNKIFKEKKIWINSIKNKIIILLNELCLKEYKSKEKESIFKDIYISDFYLELLYNLLSKENEINSTEKELMPIQSYFSFNGFNSEMVINLDSFSLDNSFLFFSFRLSPDTKTDSNTSFISYIL